MQHAVFQVGVKALFRNERGEVLVLLKPSKASDFARKDHWDLPGGRVAPGKGIEETLRRELKEELGLGEDEFQIKSVFDACLSSFPPLEGRTYLMLLVYECRLKEENTDLVLSAEHSEWKWVAPEEAARLLEKKFSAEFSRKLVSRLAQAGQT